MPFQLEGGFLLILLRGGGQRKEQVSREQAREVASTTAKETRNTPLHASNTVRLYSAGMKVRHAR